MPYNQTKPNSLVKDVNSWTTYTGDFFIVMKACIELTTLYGWGDNRRMVHHRFSQTTFLMLWNKATYPSLSYFAHSWEGMW